MPIVNLCIGVIYVTMLNSDTAAYSKLYHTNSSRLQRNKLTTARYQRILRIFRRPLRSNKLEFYGTELNKFSSLSKFYAAYLLDI